MLDTRLVGNKQENECGEDVRMDSTGGMRSSFSDLVRLAIMAFCLWWEEERKGDGSGFDDIVDGSRVIIGNN